MRVLLVEPEYRKDRPKHGKSALNDETLWYPPLGLMKLAKFHKDRGDEVCLVRGCDSSALSQATLFLPAGLWNRVYITTLFTFHFDKIVKTIKFYLDAVGGTASKIFVGGVMASLMAEDIYQETGVYPVTGVLNSPKSLSLPGKTNIDLLPPDYDLLDTSLYAVNDTYYAYATRGCPNRCPWCGVPRIEPTFIPYIDIKPAIRKLRATYGDKAVLKLMDNNVLASSQLQEIVDDLLKLGYGRGQFTNTQPKKQRIVDFNQGLDARLLTESKMRLLAQINIKPMRLGFDRVQERKHYLRAMKIANRHGVAQFSNYMLYNFKDTPRDLYERLIVNIKLNEEWIATQPERVAGKIYSYPMRFAPINDMTGNHENRRRDFMQPSARMRRNWLRKPIWTKRFVRNIEIMKGAAHGAISPTPTLARRTIGETFEEFVANLYMPEELLRNRNKHEKRVYEYEPRRRRGTGKVEDFRRFMLGLLRKQDKRFWTFHKAVSLNSAQEIRKCLKKTDDKELKRWLRMYLKRQK